MNCSRHEPVIWVRPKKLMERRGSKDPRSCLRCYQETGEPERIQLLITQLENQHRRAIAQATADVAKIRAKRRRWR